ncbi:nuclear transport factor 2 family protein [Rhodococcus sp. WS4]|nr:nuclear transport factor 2 family protein [Rhodococcus sp. WS4]
MQSSVESPLPGALDSHLYQEICRLKSDYFFALDSKDWDRLRGVFHDDARFEGFTFDGRGADDFVRGVSEWLRDMRTVHHGMMPDIRMVNPARIRGRWAMSDYLTWRDREFVYKGFEIPGMYGVRGYGFYDEEYAQQGDGRWKISFMRLTRLWIDPLVGDYIDPPRYNVPAVDTDWLEPTWNEQVRMLNEIAG